MQAMDTCYLCKGDGIIRFSYHRSSCLDSIYLSMGSQNIVTDKYLKIFCNSDLLWMMKLIYSVFRQSRHFLLQYQSQR